jgi:hypothetical protein
MIVGPRQRIASIAMDNLISHSPYPVLRNLPEAKLLRVNHVRLGWIIAAFA